MAPIARFVSGNSRLYISEHANTVTSEDQMYMLGEDFNPPALQTVPSMSSGTSANKSSGSKLLSEKTVNRTISFTIYVNAVGRSGSSVLSGIRRLEAFLQNYNAQDGMTFEVSPHDPPLPEPLWGQFGAWTRYKVVSARLSIDQNFGAYSRDERVHTIVDLDIAPYAEGADQLAANAKGRLQEDMFGVTGGVPRGMLVYGPATNIANEPYTGFIKTSSIWGSYGDPTESGIFPGYTFPGSPWTMRIQKPTTAAVRIGASITVPSSQHVMSFFFKLQGGVAPLSVSCFYNAGALVTTTISLGDGWYMAYSAPFTGTASSSQVRCYVSGNADAVYFAGAQVEAGAYPTFLLCGDNLGCAWSGNRFLSSSTADGGYIALPVKSNTFTAMSGSISCVYKPLTASASVARGIFCTKDSGGAEVSFAFIETYGTIRFRNASIAISGSFSPQANVPVRLVFTWSPLGKAMYINGVKVASDATYTPGVPTTLYIGSTGSSFHANGTIMGFDIYDRVLTDAEVSAIDKAQKPLVEAGSRVSPVPVWVTRNGDGNTDLVDDATRQNWGVVLGVAGSRHAGRTITTFSATLGGQGFSRFLKPRGLFYFDYGGTAGYNELSNSDYGSNYQAVIDEDLFFEADKLSVFMQARFSGEKLAVTNLIREGTTYAKDTALAYGNGTFSIHFCGVLHVIQKIPTYYPGYLYVRGGLVSGAHDTDFVLAIPGDTVKIPKNPYGPLVTIGKDDETINYAVGGLIGTVPNFTPGKYNMIWSFGGLITITIAPRHGLL